LTVIRAMNVIFAIRAPSALTRQMVVCDFAKRNSQSCLF
jgi:hypothetical protein